MKYDSPQSMQQSIDSYFSNGATVKHIKSGSVEYDQHIYTVTGLALYLGFPSKNALIAYAKNPSFRETVERALTLIEREYEESLQLGGGTGAQFALKQFGWKESNELIIKRESDGMQQFETMSDAELIEYQKRLALEILQQQTPEVKTEDATE